MKITNIEQLREIVKEALKNKKIKGDFFPSISVSNTDYGTSYYIQNSYGKIRISDHDVCNIDRILHEQHFASRDVDFNDLEKTIIELFSTDYVKLSLKNGNQTIVFNRHILKKDINDWVDCMVCYKEKQTMAIKMEDFPKYEILEVGDLTKRKNKRFCKVLVKKYRFGAFNKKTGEVIRTGLYLNTGNAVELCEI